MNMFYLIIFVIIVFFLIKPFLVENEEKNDKKIERKNVSAFLDEVFYDFKNSFVFPAIHFHLKRIKQHLFSIPNEEMPNIYKHLEDIKKSFIDLEQNSIKNNISYMLLLSYDKLVTTLKIKYGFVKGDYFLDKNCTEINNYIKKSDQGLQIHHVKENEVRGLSKIEYAKNYPFSYQKSENLVYCNLLEHFLLHCKIVDYSKNPKHDDVGIRGAQIICSKIISIYRDNKYDYRFYKRKEAQKVYYLKKDFWKIYRFFRCLEVLR